MLGLPGAGKSESIGHLLDWLEADVLHFKGWMKAQGHDTPLTGELLDGPMDEFLQHAMVCVARVKFVFLDGFPRSLDQAHVLWEWHLKHLAGRLVVIHVKLPYQEEERYSIQAQIARADSRDETGQEALFRQKFERAMASDMPAMDALKEYGVTVIEIEGYPRDFRTIAEDLLRALGDHVATG